MKRAGFYGAGPLLVGLTLCAGLSGCAAQHDESLRLSEELGRARVEAAWQQARAAELEARLSRLEQRASAPPAGSSAAERDLMSRLDQLIAVNERVLAAHAALIVPAPAPAPASSASTGAKAAVVAPPAPAALTPTSAPALDQEQQLRALVEKLRGHPAGLHGVLTREQENALRVLTRPERQLDADNPWPSAFY